MPYKLLHMRSTVPYDRVAWADVAATQDKLLFNNINNKNKTLYA